MNIKPVTRQALQLWLLGSIFISMVVSLGVVVARMIELSNLSIQDQEKLKAMLGVTDALGWQALAFKN
jgi:hypothetical protein